MRRARPRSALAASSNMFVSPLPRWYFGATFRLVMTHPLVHPCSSHRAHSPFACHRFLQCLLDCIMHRFSVCPPPVFPGLTIAKQYLSLLLSVFAPPGVLSFLVLGCPWSPSPCLFLPSFPQTSTHALPFARGRMFSFLCISMSAPRLYGNDALIAYGLSPYEVLPAWFAGSVAFVSSFQLVAAAFAVVFPFVWLVFFWA